MNAHLRPLNHISEHASVIGTQSIISVSVWAVLTTPGTILNSIWTVLLRDNEDNYILLKQHSIRSYLGCFTHKSKGEIKVLRKYLRVKRNLFAFCENTWTAMTGKALVAHFGIHTNGVYPVPDCIRYIVIHVNRWKLLWWIDYIIVKYNVFRKHWWSLEESLL